MRATRLEVLERNLTRAFVRYHADAQIRRVVGVFFGALTMQLLTGFHDWTWKGLLAVAAAAGYVTLRKAWPTVPWSLVLHHVHIQQAQAPAPDLAMPPQTASAPTADQVYTPVTQSPAVAQPPGERPDPALPS